VGHTLVMNTYGYRKLILRDRKEAQTANIPSEEIKLI
jgi:hypothetical protein